VRTPTRAVVAALLSLSFFCELTLPSNGTSTSQAPAQRVLPMTTLVGGSSRERRVVELPPPLAVRKVTPLPASAYHPTLAPEHPSARGVRVFVPTSMLHPDFKSHLDPLAMRRKQNAPVSILTVPRSSAARVSTMTVNHTTSLASPDITCPQLSGSGVVSPNCVGKPTMTPTPAPTATPINAQNPIVPTITGNTGTGRTPWWGFFTDSVNGIGSSLLNAATGNLVVQVRPDMQLANAGWIVPFQRTYNSQSTHNVSGADGGYPSLYGNGWTNTFDAHLMNGPNGGRLSTPAAPDTTTRRPERVAGTLRRVSTLNSSSMAAVATCGSRRMVRCCTSGAQT